MRGHQVTINDKKYNIACIFNMPRKLSNIDDFGVQLEITVYSLEEKRYMKWDEIRGTYLAEKLSDFAENSFNGQNSFYWNIDLMGV